MINVVIIDFNSSQRTKKYVDDFLKIKINEKVSFVIVDNSPSQHNFEDLKKSFNVDNNMSNLNKKEWTSIEKLGRYIDEMYKGTYFSNNNLAEIIILKSNQNYGFAKGNNIGAEIARKFFEPEYLIFSNNDIIFDEHTFEFEAIKNCFKNDKNIALVGPKVIGLREESQSPHKKMSIWRRWIWPYFLWPLGTILAKLNVKYPSGNDILTLNENQYVYRIIGAFMVFNAEKFYEIGMFDENTFLYAEEMILAEKLRLNNYRTYFLNDIKIIHEHGFTTDKIMNRLKKLKLRFESEIYYFRNYTDTKAYSILVAKYLFFIFTIIYYCCSILRKNFVKKSGTV